MVYKEFEPDRPFPIRQANWAGELASLQQSALDTIGWVAVIAGYAWTVGQLLSTHPRVEATPLAVPLSIGILGTLVVVVSRPLGLRRFLLVSGAIIVAAVALLVERSQPAPFALLVAISSATLLPGLAPTFVTAAVSSALIGAVWWILPEPWPEPLLLGAVVLCWANATISWLTSRNLHSVLSWALQGYEEAWHTTRELQIQRGKLNRTLKDLADANLLLRRTTYDLAEAREESEHARQLKSQFAANISHELRTPLHLIVGFSQMMHMSPDNYEGVTWTPELRGDVAEIYESATHLLRLIDDVLDLAQIEAARLPVNKERIDLAPLIQDTVETAKSLLRDGSLALRLKLPDDLPAVYADPTRIRQILLNLLNNAVRFTDAGSITVEARTTPEIIEVIVTDTGIGMTEGQLSEIFQEFHQVDGSLRRKYAGTGLGLALCRQFVRLHGGHIWAESEVGKGSAFHFTIPLPDRASPALQPSGLPHDWRYPASKPEGAHRLVVLSRPPEFARLLSRHLSGVQVIEVADHTELLATAQHTKADAIVLPENAVPDRPGVEEEIAAGAGELRLPVITCSWPLEQTLAASQGFASTLMKPFATQHLLDSLEQVAPDARRLLVVDDDPGVGRLVERALRARKHDLEIDLAYDGLEAIRLLDQAPDAILLDLILPGVDGLGVLHELHQRPGGREVPAIAITARSFAQDMADLGSGLIQVRRATHFTANEITRWLTVVCEAFPARYLEPGGPDPEPAPAPPG